MNDNHHKPNLAIGQGELMDDRAQQANGQAIGGGARYNTQGLSAAYWDDETVEGATTEDIEVILTETGEYVVRLTADDGVDIGEAAVTITVYSDSCAAALGQGATLLQTDFNGDCVTDFAALAVFAGEWFVSIAL